ncbi:MAG TPA: sterol desaturase family protein, partial [Thermoanaerobaculia bacterium]|nr:sterol desaturase family protein [Thermoanaerobaculia bacterium]
LFIYLSPRVQFLHHDFLAKLPPLVSIPLCWITFDFLNYWIHRLQHTVRPLWAFHSVHHTATQLTMLTGNRIHAFEQLYVSLMLLVPVLLLGIQPRWLPIVFAQVLLETLQHARVRWSFGPLYRIVVSPRFHAFHHSADEREHNGNYGRIFSCWDVLFGTFVSSTQPVRRFGVDDMVVPERLTAQFFHPFRYLASTLRSLPRVSADARGRSVADPARVPQ